MWATSRRGWASEGRHCPTTRPRNRLTRPTLTRAARKGSSRTLSIRIGQQLLTVVGRRDVEGHRTVRQAVHELVDDRCGGRAQLGGTPRPDHAALCPQVTLVGNAADLLPVLR